MEAICGFGALANNYIDKNAPWVLKKSSSSDDRVKFKIVLYVLAECSRILAINLLPFVPVLAGKMLDLLEVGEEFRDFSCLGGGFALKGGVRIDKPVGVFVRL